MLAVNDDSVVFQDYLVAFYGVITGWADEGKAVDAIYFCF